MKHPIHRIVSFGIVAPYTLNLGFDDGLSRTIDFEPILEGELFGPLRDPALFAQARLDPEVHTVVWPTGADFDPAVLHGRLGRTRGQLVVVPNRPRHRCRSSLIQGAGSKRPPCPSTGSGPFAARRRLTRSSSSGMPAAGHEQAVLGRRVEWLPGLGSNQRPSD
jgi:hypothetical protein